MSFIWLSTSAPGDLLPAVVPSLLALLGLVILGAILLTALRRAVRSSGSSTADDFTLQHLRDLHARGDLSDEEFQRAKTAIIARTRGAMSGDAPKDESTGHDDARE